MLREAASLPEHMDFAGTLPPENSKYLCVVGSRKNSNYGRDVCRTIIGGLRGYPIVIVSGLAIGIDSIAHESALEAGLVTISFPGSGLSMNALYPSSRRGLAIKIIEKGGALYSSFDEMQSGTQWTFPHRNRFMAGSAHATLVIEAKEGSGTLITAKHAEYFHRDVLAVPGMIFNELSSGPNNLIRDGATPITSSADVLEALGFDVVKNTGGTQSLLNLSEMNLSGEQREIIEFLKVQALSSTDLIEKTGHSATQFSTIISDLELMGLVTEVNGYYRIK